jgi:hypothetical protein
MSLGKKEKAGLVCCAVVVVVILQVKKFVQVGTVRGGVVGANI